MTLENARKDFEDRFYDGVRMEDNEFTIAEFFYIAGQESIYELGKTEQRKKQLDLAFKAGRLAGLDAAKGAVPGEEAEQLPHPAIPTSADWALFNRVKGHNKCRQQTLDAIELEKGKV